jgi:tRNA threonylcarbamoyl adenosine modification protein YjeE
MCELVHTASVAATLEFGRGFARRLSRGDCVALVGNLGAGKTVLARGIALGLGLADERMVSSPTFVLVQEYPCRVPVYHLDLYRLTAPGAELGELGLDEMLRDGVVLIEWADRAAPALPRPRWELSITLTGQHHREIQIHRVDGPHALGA